MSDKSKSQHPSAELNANPETRPNGSACIRSEDRLAVPHYRRAQHSPPDIDSLLKIAGVIRTRALSGNELRATLKPPEDLPTVADDIVDAYRADSQELGLKDLDADRMESLLERVKYLDERVQRINEVATIINHQQVIARSDLYDSCLRIRRRVNALSEESPELAKRWKFLENYFARVRTGIGTRDDSAGESSSTS